jgi:rRNA small subunit pseudouridine methyltransferase Nep1
MVVLLLAESALETVPPEIANHPAVVKHARRKGKKATEILLDRSFHHSAMKGLELEYKRGRPDIVYHVLLDVTNSPLYREGKLTFIIHTIGDWVIRVGSGVRPPRAYFRFEGLMEKLFKERSIRSRDGKVLFSIEKRDVGGLMEELSPDLVIGFSRIGEYRSLEDVVKDCRFGKPLFIIGGFPKGHFSDRLMNRIDRLYSIHKMRLDSSLVAARLVYEIEKQGFNV